MTRSAPSRYALLIANRPDRPASPDRDRVARLDVAHLGAHVAGRQDVGEEEHLLVGEAVLDLERPDVGERHARELGLAAGKAAGEVRVAERARRRVAHHLLGERGVRIRVLAERPVVVPALPAVAAGDGERDDHPIADLELLDRSSDLDHFAHELVAEDVALLHGRDEPVVEVQVRAADRGRRDSDDRVALIEDLRIGDIPHFDVLLAHPAGRLHRRTSVSGAWAARCFDRPCPAPSRLPSERTTSPVSITCFNRRRSSPNLLRRLLAEQFRNRRARLAPRARRSGDRRGLRCRGRREPVRSGPSLRGECRCPRATATR